MAEQLQLEVSLAYQNDLALSLPELAQKAKYFQQYRHIYAYYIHTYIHTYNKYLYI